MDITASSCINDVSATVDIADKDLVAAHACPDDAVDVTNGNDGKDVNMNESAEPLYSTYSAEATQQEQNNPTMDETTTTAKTSNEIEHSGKSKRKRKSSSSSSRKRSTKKKVPENAKDFVVAGDYWEIEKIEAFRKNSKLQKKGHKPVYEFLVKWKGFEERTWEPEENFSDSALLDAYKLISKQAEQQLGLDEPESFLQNHIDDDDEEEAEFTDLNPTEKEEREVSVDAKKDVNDSFEDPNWQWSDQGHINFREIERIDVNSPNARIIVSENRQNGVPVVLTGHVGWAQFASRWLDSLEDEVIQTNGSNNGTKEAIEVSTDEAEKNIVAEKEEIDINKDNGIDSAIASGQPNENDFFDDAVAFPPESTTLPADMNLLDLSKLHYVNVEKMIADIGRESVPVIRKKYNEQNPLEAQITVETFLQKCWPTRGEIDKTEPMRKLPWLYLHQWQFPLSGTALPKLCGPGRNYPLPNHIFGDDLLCYWLDKDKCKQDSPYQYLFMGREGTKSNLHRDNGGLTITIAPIVGMKEVTLVHRADGASCLYHLDANIDNADLHRFPMMYSVRAWKSVLKPGEILIMPQGTYHQCRNVTPCLSYHRFYLDTLNLKAFLESFLDQDAPEIQHDDVIWNAAHELTEKVHDFVEQVKGTSNADLPNKIISAVDALRVLRNISRELTIRAEVKVRQKGGGTSTDVVYQWSAMVDDIDQALHCFRFRLRKRIPHYVRRKEPKEKHNESKKRNSKKSENSKSESNDTHEIDVDNDDNDPPRTILEGAIQSLPKLSKDETGVVVPDSIRIGEGNSVSFRLHGRRAVGKIETIQDSIIAAYLQYEEFPPCHEEYQTIDRLRCRVAGGETSVEVSPEALHSGMHVLHVEQGGEEYRAMVKSWKKATFYLVNLDFESGTDFVYKQWITRESIIDVIENNSCPDSDQKLPMTPKNKPLASPNPMFLKDESVPLQSSALVLSSEQAETDLYSTGLANSEADSGMQNDLGTTNPDADFSMHTSGELMTKI